APPRRSAAPNRGRDPGSRSPWLETCTFRFGDTNPTRVELGKTKGYKSAPALKPENGVLRLTETSSRCGGDSSQRSTASGIIECRTRSKRILPSHDYHDRSCSLP